MKTTKALLACLLFCFAVNHISADDSKDDVALEKKSDSQDFFAARGRRSDDSSNGAVSPDDFFWANRGKRSTRVLRDQGNFNVPRPNGFFFPSAGKRSSSYNIPRPNGFFFPSATGKRGLSRFFPKSKTFFHLPKNVVDAIRAQRLINNPKFRRSQNWQQKSEANAWPQWPYIKPRLI